MKSNIALTFKNKEFKGSLRNSQKRESKRVENGEEGVKRFRTPNKRRIGDQDAKKAKTPNKKMNPYSTRTVPRKKNKKAFKSFTDIYDKHLKPQKNKSPIPDRNEGLTVKNYLSKSKQYISFGENADVSTFDNSHLKIKTKKEKTMTPLSYNMFLKNLDQVLCLFDLEDLEDQNYYADDIFDFLMILRSHRDSPDKRDV
jgi:hypothetical protein